MSIKDILKTWRPQASDSNNELVANSEPALEAAEVEHESQVDEPIHFSDAAANKVKELITEEENGNLKLRVFITGGGCSGFQYGFTFDEDVNDDDFELQKNGVTLLIDAMSMQYLEEAEIDYKDDLNGSQFVIRNPNAVTTCGCGSSFSVD